MKHNILQFQITMDNKFFHHVVEAIDQLKENLLYDSGNNSPLFEFHHLLEITAVAEFHEDVISGVSFDSLAHFDNIWAFNGVLVLYLADNQIFFSVTKVSSFNHFASV